MNDYELLDDLYWEQFEQEQQEQYRKEKMDMEEIIHSNCKLACELVYISVHYEDHMPCYQESYECKQCGMWRVYDIDHDDFLARKSQGFEVRS